MSIILSTFRHWLLTVTAWLDGSLDVSNALNRHTVLVISVHKLVFQLSDFIDEHTELIGDIRDVIVSEFTPYR